MFNDTTHQVVIETHNIPTPDPDIDWEIWSIGEHIETLKEWGEGDSDIRGIAEEFATLWGAVKKRNGFF